MADGFHELTAGDLEQTIRENAEGPGRATVDGQTMEQHRLTDQIAADRYLNSKRAMKKGLGIRLRQICHAEIGSSGYQPLPMRRIRCSLIVSHKLGQAATRRAKSGFGVPPGLSPGFWRCANRISKVVL